MSGQQIAVGGNPDEEAHPPMAGARSGIHQVMKLSLVAMESNMQALCPVVIVQFTQESVTELPLCTVTVMVTYVRIYFSFSIFLHFKGVDLAYETEYNCCNNGAKVCDIVGKNLTTHSN